MNSDRDTPQVALGGWVAPFGDPGITDRSHLPRAFRSVPRPSSPLSAKASTRCPCFALDHRRLPSEDAAQPPRTGPRPPKGFRPARRPRMKTLLRIGATQVWLRRPASVTSQLSLHPSINTLRSAKPRPGRVFLLLRTRQRRRAAPPVVEVNGIEPMTSCWQSRPFRT